MPPDAVCPASATGPQFRAVDVAVPRFSYRPRPASASTRRDGFTLTELVVALMLLTVGLLALASTSAFLGYEHAAAGRAEAAAVVAGSRLERLRVAGCNAQQGTELVDGMTSSWSVAMAGTTAIATVSVSWRERGAPTEQRYASGFAC